MSNLNIQVVQTDSGWHLRIKGANGEKMMTSEVYTRRETAEESLDVITNAINLGEWTTTFSDERILRA